MLKTLKNHYKKIDKRYFIFLSLIFLFALFIRLINFKESIYFGYDEARDAYDSQAIYLEGDIKLSGPPASAFRGINHGPLYLYLIGPLFLLGGGEPYLASFFFRLVNASGVFLIAYLVSLFFNRRIGLIAAIMYSLSFEQHQYAIFTGNPAISNIFWLVLFLGAAIVYKNNDKKKIKIGTFLMFFGASFIAQFDLILSYAFLSVLLLLLLLRKKLRVIKFKEWLIILALGFIPMYSYPLAEIKNNFLGIKTLLFEVIFKEASIVSQDVSLSDIFSKNLAGLFDDNIFKSNSVPISLVLLSLVLLFLFVRHKKDPGGNFILVWIASIGFLLLTRGFMPYYSYAGIGIGVIIAVSVILYEVLKKNRLAFFLLIAFIAITNLNRINMQSLKSLIVDIKAQPDMKLSDEIKVVKKSYDFAENTGFTIRTITMPYRIQTVWAYLYKQYGQKKYGYLPYYETRNILGYPGVFPEPQGGTTCKRILIREPIRGIPEVLINKDISEENLFSEIVKEEKIGEFLVQFRKVSNSSCHQNKAS